MGGTENRCGWLLAAACPQPRAHEGAMTCNADGDKQFHARVSGRVQGVGFRFFVHREATRLGVHGWVRNLVDGQVEMVASGPKDKLDQLLQRVRAGPSLGWVEGVSVVWQEPDSPEGFEIRSTSW